MAAQIKKPSAPKSSPSANKKKTSKNARASPPKKKNPPPPNSPLPQKKKVIHQSPRDLLQARLRRQGLLRLHRQGGGARRPHQHARRHPPQRLGRHACGRRIEEPEGPRHPAGSTVPPCRWPVF